MGYMRDMCDVMGVQQLNHTYSHLAVPTIYFNAKYLMLPLELVLHEHADFWQTI